MKDFIPGFPDEVAGRDPLGAAGAFGTKPPAKGEKSKSWSPGSAGLRREPCVCAVPTPLLKPHRRSPILLHLPMEDLGKQATRTFGARMRRTFIPAQFGVSPPPGDSQGHPRPDSAPEGTGGLGGRCGVPSALPGAGFRFSRCLPGGERGAPAWKSRGENGADHGQKYGKRERRVRGAEQGMRRRGLRSPKRPMVPARRPPPSPSRSSEGEFFQGGKCAW